MNDIKATLTGVVTAIYIWVSAYFGVFTPLLVLTLVAMFCDLVTRIYAAGSSETEKVESKKVMLGIYRKLGMCMLIILTLILDSGLVLIADTLGINVATKIIFTAFTLAWIFVRELISNLENLALAGIDLPKFIVKALNIARDKIDSAADLNVQGGNKDGDTTKTINH
ncbi:phage holin family protein [Cellulosilyticum sp. WCF-2]|uniref:phage holin family protein n=1 Tax=Cellulosilyticum sp. WCF-2 TaxID=2497860 RepID=UPI000F8D09CB|nr:phage holin family protein [Cellulosilyticum sp. WCF-2]QEH68230.1 phage holin family protein [Cellulosilyticum sp. WCF-2]